VFLGIHLTKSETRLVPKRCPFFERKRGSGSATHPSGKVLTCLLLPKRDFQVPIFIHLKIFLRGGTKSILMCRLALGMECRVVSSGTQQFDTTIEWASWYVLPGAICTLSKAISGCVASAAPHRSLGLQ